MENEIATDLAIEDVARRLLTSRRQLQRAFAEYAHTGFRTYLCEVRMRRAAELLVSTERRVQDIARSVGYTQPAQFAKAFHRVYGTPPVQYRRNPWFDAVAA